jgi:hypothetical protein
MTTTPLLFSAWPFRTTVPNCSADRGAGQITLLMGTTDSMIDCWLYGDFWGRPMSQFKVKAVSQQTA